MANPNMTDHIYSTAPQAISRFLASENFARSRKVRGRLCDYDTTGFRVWRVLGETRVEWLNDVREYRTDATTQARLKVMAKALGKRYEVARRGDALIVSERILKPEVLTFNKRWGALGPNYVAETDNHRYVVRRDPKNTKQWELRVFTLVPVGHIDPIMVAGEFVFGSTDDRKSGVIEDAHAFLKRQSK